MKNTILILSALLLLAACGGEESASIEAPSELSTLDSFERIKAMEDSVYNQKVFDPRGVRSLYDVYVAHVAKFPNDTITPHVLFRAASTAKQLNLSNKAVEMYDQIINEHSDWFKVVDAMYMKAFTLDDMAGKVEEARGAYQDVIAKYPDHKYAADAKVMMNNVELSDEELIKQFELMNQDKAQ